MGGGVNCSVIARAENSENEEEPFQLQIVIRRWAARSRVRVFAMPLVLVIDDEAALRKLLRRVLEAAGYRVLEAANGRIGMEILMKERPYAVISDILMPEKEGIETIIEIRRALPDAKVIAISGGGAAHNTMFLAAAQKLGAHAAISKPFRTSDLVDVMNNLLASA